MGDSASMMKWNAKQWLARFLSGCGNMFTPQLGAWLAAGAVVWFLNNVYLFWAPDNSTFLPLARCLAVLTGWNALIGLFGALFVFAAIYGAVLLLPEKYRPAAFAVLLLPALVIGGANFYLVVHYSCPLMEMMQIVRSTDMQEVREYFLSMASGRAFFLPALLGVSVLAASVCIYFVMKHLRAAKSRVWIVSPLYCLPMAVMMLFYAPDASPAWTQFPVLYPLCHYAEKDFFLRSAADVVRSPRFPAGSENCLKNVSVTGVFALGESDNRHHHSLYGYGRETDPDLKTVREHLILFTDVLSATSSTVHSFYFMMTDADIHDRYGEIHYGACDFFRHAGARVSFRSIQRAHGSWASITPVLFAKADYLQYFADDGKNHFDEELLPDLTREIAADSGAVFTLAHMFGSHYDQRFRIPQKWASENAAIIKDLDTYDKSIVYTGSVLAELVRAVMKKDSPAFLLYVSDHSEEPESRRSMTVPDPVYYEIPMWICFNEAYRKAFPDLVRQTEAIANKPFQTDRMLSLVQRLMGVPANLLKASDDPLSPDFQLRSRLVGWGQILYPEPKQ